MVSSLRPLVLLVVTASMAACAGGGETYDLDASATLQIRHLGASGSGKLALATVDVGESDGSRLVVGDVDEVNEGRGRVVERIPGWVGYRDPVWIDEDRVAALRPGSGEDSVLVVVDVPAAQSETVPGPELTIRDNLFGANEDGTVLVGDVSDDPALSLVRAGAVVGEVPLLGGEVDASLCADGSVLLAVVGNGGRGWWIVYDAPWSERTTLLEVPGGRLTSFGADPDCDRVLVDGSFAGGERRDVWLLEPGEAPAELAIRVGRPSFADAGTVVTLGSDGVQVCDLPCDG